MAEKNYLAIAKQKIVRPKSMQSYRKILVYGRKKRGKTRFSLSGGIESTLVLDPENGTDTMKHLNPYVWPLTKWEDLQEAYGALRTGKLSPKFLGQGSSTEPFTWVSVDGLTKLNNMALHYVRRVAEERDLDRQPGMIDRRDYNKSGELMKQMLANFHTMKMNVIYTAQERMISTEEDDETSESSYFFVPDLPQAVRGDVNSLVEVIGRIYTTRVTVKLKGGSTEERIQRRLWVGIHEKYDTGYRSDFVMPDFVKSPTLPKLVALMLTGTEEGE